MTSQARGLLRRSSALLMLLVIGWLPSCSVRADDIADEAARRMEHAKESIREELESHLTRATRALDSVENALMDANDPAAHFEALETLRADYGLSGLLWEDPGGNRAWAGDPVESKSLPADQPWQRSFRSGVVTVHIGPYLRALVIGPRPALGGYATATVVLEREGPGESTSEAFAQRWAGPLHLSSVHLIPPAGDGAVPEGPYSGETSVRAADGTVAFRVQVRAHDPEALEEQLEEASDRQRGIAMLVAWALAIFLIARFGIARLPRRSWRLLSGAGLVLIAREVLKHFDMHAWFPNLEDAFSPSEFALDTPLDWLSSPADFALSSVAYLLVAVFAGLVLRRVRIPRQLGARALLIFGGPLVAAAAAAGWQALVEKAVRGSGTPFFRVDSFFPGAPATLMLVSLIVTTATAYLIAQMGMRLSRRAFGMRRDWPVRILIGFAGGAAAWYLGHQLGTTHWVAMVMPMLAALFAGRDERSGIAPPSRVLLISVIATALAYPVLWSQVAEREGEALGRHLDTLLGAEAITQTSVALSLQEVQNDLYLRRALRASLRGPFEREGVAFHLWLLSDFGDGRMPVMVSVLAPRGGMIDQFALTGIPPAMLPYPQRSITDSDTPQVMVTRSEPDKLRCVVGRARIRDDDGAVLGHVVFTVPDALDIQLHDLHQYGPGDQLIGRPLTTGQRAQFAVLRAGLVVGSSSPSVSRLRGGFGPESLSAVGPEKATDAWIDDAHQGSAVWREKRGSTFAIRKALPGFGEAMLASARVVLVGVGLGVIVAIAWLLVSLPTFRLRLQHKIFLSYFLISVIPLVLLGLASANDARQRFERRLSDRLGSDLSRMRRDLEKMVGGGWESLQDWTPQWRHDALIYVNGRLERQSRPGLVTAELLQSRLPAAAYRATVLQKRRLIQRQADYAGRPVWFGFEPVLDSNGNTRATVGVPLLYDQDRMAEEVTISGNVLLAAYLLTLVLVLVGGIYAANNIARPIGLLARGTRRIARGDLDVVLPESGSDELGQLVANFNAMTRELRDTTERAVRAEREMAWRKMARQVAHEIKNPLTPMRLMIQQMEADIARDPSRAQEAIQRTSKVVLRQIEGLSRIAGDFANFARLPKRDRADVDLGELVREVTELHHGSASVGITVRCEIEPDLPSLYWDQEELRRVLINLVRNGVQAIEKTGEVTLQAYSQTHDAERGVALRVTDTGVGIDPEDRPRLFEPHFSTKTSGMGLGLAIVHRIVTDSGGTIAVESRPGKGASFTIWWPTDWNRRSASDEHA